VNAIKGYAELLLEEFHEFGAESARADLDERFVSDR
jgi:hypothetical protein